MPVSSKASKSNRKPKNRRSVRTKAYRAPLPIAYRRNRSRKDLPYTISADCQPELW